MPSPGTDAGRLPAELARQDALARHHKREAERHRRRARAARTRQAELAAECRRLGIACETAPPSRP